MNDRISSFIKWPGGKEQELTYIMPAIPKFSGSYYEPFVGGGAVYLAMKSNKMYINDKSKELIKLYNSIKTQDKEFLSKLFAINKQWKLLSKIIEQKRDVLSNIYHQYSENLLTNSSMEDCIVEFIIKNEKLFNGILSSEFNIKIDRYILETKKNILSKIRRMKKIETDKGKLSDNDTITNLETGFKSGYYMHFRYLLNNSTTLNISEGFLSAIFYFIREFCYASMFRFNSKGEFNVPYGGLSYNHKNFEKKIFNLESDRLVSHLKKSIITNLDFEDFFKKYTPGENDFIFLDPPYDTDFSTYDKNSFNKDDQKRLADFLLSRCKAKFLLIIKQTDFISKLYNSKKVKISSFEKNYLVSFQNRNDKEAKHLMITNY